MVVRSLLGVVAVLRAPDADTVEIAVLRHQLAVLHRQARGRGTHTGAYQPPLADFQQLDG
jgi:hypothetical protein